jgi:hypothetical protein
VNVKLLIAFVIPLVATVSGFKSAEELPRPHEYPQPDPRTFTPIGTLQAEQPFRDYIVRVYREPQGGEGSFEILKGRQRVYAAVSHEFEVSSLHESETAGSMIAIGKDITGTGKPNLVVSEWTGGAHCCYFAHIFDIGKEFRKVAMLDAKHGPLDFADLDKDGRLEFIFRDWTFAYWRTSFNYSPAPKVILRYRDGAYRVAGDLMRQPPPTVKELEKQAGKVRDHEHWKEREPPSDLWHVMLDLIYTGNTDLALQFLEKAWKPGVTGKEEFLKDFRAELAKSPYWPEVQAMNAK